MLHQNILSRQYTDLKDDLLLYFLNIWFYEENIKCKQAFDNQVIFIK